jgi:hypothetical protein
MYEMSVNSQSAADSNIMENVNSNINIHRFTDDSVVNVARSSV